VGVAWRSKSIMPAFVASIPLSSANRGRHLRAQKRCAIARHHIAIRLACGADRLPCDFGHPKPIAATSLSRIEDQRQRVVLAESQGPTC